MLTPKVALQIGNLLYDSHAIALRLRRGLAPIVDRLEVTLPRDVRFDAAAGDEVKLELDGGEGALQVFTGEVSSIRRSLRGVGITAHDGGLALGRYRPTLSIEGSTVGEIIEALASDAGVDTGTLEDGPKIALYVADGRAGALEEIARLAAFADALASFDGEGKLFVEAFGSSAHAGEMAWKYGRELLDLELERMRPDASSMTLVGEGAGEAGSSQALWPIADFLGGSAPAAGPEARRRAAPELHGPDDATAASNAWMLRRARAEIRIKLRAWLAPAVAPGTRIELQELQELPAAIDASALIVRQVVHVVDPDRGAHSEVWGTEEASAPGLLDQLLGAVGGLL
jgi:hypothetical protein